MTHKLFIEGEPVPQGRGRIIKKGPHFGIKDPEKSKAWKESVKWQATSEKNRQRLPVMDGALNMRLVFMLTRPKSAKNRLRPCVRPDLDNFVKAIKDGLNGVLYHDDGQIVDLIASKVYCDPGQNPGVLVEVKGV